MKVRIIKENRLRTVTVGEVYEALFITQKGAIIKIINPCDDEDHYKRYIRSECFELVED